MEAPLNEKRTFNHTIKAQAKLFELSKKQKKYLHEMAKLRHAILNGEQLDFKLIQSYKRKSNCMVNDDNKTIVKTWIENGCTKTVPSPNQQDTVIIKNDAGQVISQERVLLYTKSKGHLYHEFCKKVEHGGCNLARDEDGLIVVGRTTFEKLLPERTLKRMNETHKQYCACRECLNSEWMHEAMMKNCDKQLATLENLMNFVVTRNTNAQAIQHHTRNYNDYRDFGYNDTGKQNWATINDAYL